MYINININKYKYTDKCTYIYLSSLPKQKKKKSEGVHCRRYTYIYVKKTRGEKIMKSCKEHQLCAIYANVATADAFPTRRLLLRLEMNSFPGVLKNPIKNWSLNRDRDFWLCNSTLCEMNCNVARLEKRRRTSSSELANRSKKKTGKCVYQLQRKRKNQN